ncbi:MAG TPA: hypothetical protein VI114_01990 [Chthoniobacterales bacterium]
MEGDQDFYQMTNGDQTHPLGEEETDEINPTVVDGLTPEQLEWLNSQSTVTGCKKLQILRQALFEWVSEHMEYRFNEARFGDTVRRALDEFMNRNRSDIALSKTGRRVGDAPQR